MEWRDTWIWRMRVWKKIHWKDVWLRRMHGGCRALMNAWFGNKNEPEGCLALKHAWFGDIEGTGRIKGFEECMEDAWL